MNRFWVLIRLFLLLAFLSSPFVAFGAAVAGRTGALGGVAIGIVFLLTLGRACRSMACRFHRAKRNESVGLARTVSIVSSEAGVREPEIFIFPDPAPNLLLAKSWGKNAALLMSEGLLAQLEEGELRCILKISLQQRKKSGLVVQTIASVCAALLYSLAFRADRLGREFRPVRILRLLLILPWVRLLIRLGGPSRAISADLARAIQDFKEAEAVRKVRNATEIWTITQGNPGFIRMYFQHPWPRHELFGRFLA